MSSLLLAEARRVTRQRLRKLLLRYDLIDKLTDHRVLARTDQVEILSFYLVHHGVHLLKGHNARNHIRADHERRYTVRKSAIDHEISRIRDNRRVKSCDITHKIIESVSCHISGSIQIYTVMLFHNLSMIGNLEIRYHRLAELLNLDIFRIILTDRHTRIDDIWDYHHPLFNLFGKCNLLLFQSLEFLSLSCDFSLYLFSLVTLSLSHQRTDLFGPFIPCISNIIRFLLYIATFFIILDNLVDKRKLFLLELFLDIFLNYIRILSYKFDI